MRLNSSLFIVLFIFNCFACTSHKQQSIDALTMRESQVKERSLQSRLFYTSDEILILSASAELLQDLSYQINETESSLGVITASRNKSAVKTGQVTIAVLGALLGGDLKYDSEEKIYVTIVVKPENNKATKVRVTFQHVVRNNEGQVTANKQIDDAELYQEFFDKLSKSVFLQAHPIAQ
jgi:hypothetical protein